MHLTRRAPMAVATRWADGELIREYDLRSRAIDFLRGKLAERNAGLDPYDDTILIVQVGAHEKVWANRCLELVGLVMDATDTDHGRRFRAVVEADVRAELGLDQVDAPRMTDEPLRSRAVDIVEVAPDVFMPSRPLLYSLPVEQVDEPESMLALRRARQAYDERQVH